MWTLNDLGDDTSLRLLAEYDLSKEESANYTHKLVVSFVSDVHIGSYKGPVPIRAGEVDYRGAARLFALHQSRGLADASSAPDTAAQLFVCGDLFDTVKTHPSWITLNDHLTILLRYNGYVKAIAGNHDVESNLYSQSPLHVGMEEHSAVTITGLIYAIRGFAIPYKKCWSQIEYLESELHRGYTPPREGLDAAYVVAHMGVWDDKTSDTIPRHTSSSVSASDALQLLSNANVNTMFVGDWHKSGAFTNGKSLIVQCGALCPIDWADAGPDNGYVYHAEILSFGPPCHPTMPAPRVVRIFREGIPGIPQFESIQYSENATVQIEEIIQRVEARGRVPFVRLVTDFKNLAPANMVADKFDYPVEVIVKAEASGAAQPDNSSPALLRTLEEYAVEYVNAHYADSPIRNDILESTMEAINRAQRK